jgi:23S rRNA pseudouridine1911/1915/1917 synthase
MKPTAGTVHHVTAADRGQTLAAFLRAKLAGESSGEAEGPKPNAASWSQVQKLVRSRHVLVHGNICTDVARRLKEGEVVKVLAAAAAAPPKADDVRVVYLDDQVVVVDKPTGITTTRHTEELSWPTRRRQVQPTLDEMVPDAIAGYLLARHGARGRGRRCKEARAPGR